MENGYIIILVVLVALVVALWSKLLPNGIERWRRLSTTELGDYLVGYDGCYVRLEDALYGVFHVGDISTARFADHAIIIRCQWVGRQDRSKGEVGWTAIEQPTPFRFPLSTVSDARLSSCGRLRLRFKDRGHRCFIFPEGYKYPANQQKVEKNHLLGQEEGSPAAA